MKHYNKYAIRINSVFFLSFTLFVFSCQSVEEKPDTAYEKAKISKEFTDDSLEMETEAKLAPLLATKPIKVVEVNPWIKYSKEIEKEIKINEKMIVDLRVASENDAKEFKKIAALEKKNQELQKRLVDFNQEAESNLEKFKFDLKADMIELEQELKELSASIQKK